MTDLQHHAYLYEGSLSELPALAEWAREHFNFEPTSPDVHVLGLEKFGIDDAHALKASASLRAASGKALYLVGVGSITSEAQQALLKLLEEPQQGVTFIFITPHGALIPTLRSRMEDLDMPANRTALKNKASSSATLAHKFISLSPKARSAEVAALLKDEEGVRERVREFLSALEVLVYEKLDSATNSSSLLEALEDISKVRSYLSDRSPSLKMLLEHLALSLPSFK